MLEDLYKKLVMEHAKYKHNYGKLEGEDVTHVFHKNPTCGDVISLFLKENDSKIYEVAFEGDGCSISMASSSMMTDLIKGESIEKIKAFKAQFEQLIREGKEPEEDLGDALALQGVHKLRARHNCALVAWQALEKAIIELE
jgi:nitrogen fixation NifU-like protein